MTYYLINTTLGMCVREASSLRTARAQGRREFGARHFQSAVRATLDDLKRVRKYGGWLPESARPLVEEPA